MYTLVVFAYVELSLFIYLFHTHIDVVVGLLVTSSMYIYVSLAFVLSLRTIKDIRSFPFA